MSKGFRFFGTDHNNLSFDNTVTVSSRDGNKDFMFDNLIYTRWISNGEDSDGDSVSVEVDYGTNRTFDSFYVYNTNIDDIGIDYWNGSSWVAVSGLTKSDDGRYVFGHLSSSVTATKVRITGSNTITADQEKSVTLFYTFLEIGQFEYFPDAKYKNNNKQDIKKLDDGRNFIIERGGAFEEELRFKSHVNQNDIDLMRTLIDRKEPFYVWPCGGDTSIFTYSFKPYRFQDIFKVAIVGSDQGEYTKNYYHAGYNDKIKMIEVA
jgi:hypothetical protein